MAIKVRKHEKVIAMLSLVDLQKALADSTNKRRYFHIRQELNRREARKHNPEK